MNHLPVRLSETAEIDITEAFKWYQNRSRKAAESFRTEILSAIDRLASAPDSWKTDEDGNHHFVLKRFPFSVVFALTTDAIVIIAVSHHRRRPGYWRSLSA
ncbi:MAG: type II toxin-antitoxin system RelE/ParE family toxin [Burkholderiaceae bacterium]